MEEFADYPCSVEDLVDGDAESTGLAIPLTGAAVFAVVVEESDVSLVCDVG